MTELSKEYTQKVNDHFPGKVVRKDLTKFIKGNAVVPTYVLEYLLGQYCATDDEETISQGLEMVKSIVSKHFVHRDESQLIRSKIREKGSHRVIDKISAHLNERKDHYEINFSNLALKNIPVQDNVVRQHKKLLTGGVWCIVNVGYVSIDDKDAKPWVIESLDPIQVSNVNVEQYKEARSNFSKEEWIDLLIHSIGLQPEEFNFRTKVIQLSRLIPFAENNYNMIELGPKGTGKSHIFSELSPHGILISGGEVTKAKLFVNNSTGDLGLVGYWDVVAYDEFAGRTKRPDKGLVDIMKNYMANKSFSRGTEVYTASASMVFVGNTDHSVEYMLKHTHLFESLPETYQDSAFLDRVHSYLPGWEVQKLRTEMFSDQYGFIVDYLAEVLKELRKEDFTNLYLKDFSLSKDLTTRDKTGISKTLSGLLKVIYPHGEFTKEQAQELLDFAVESRKRVQRQLVRMDETFEAVEFSYTVNSSGEKHSVDLLEEINLGIKENYSKATQNKSKASSHLFPDDSDGGGEESAAEEHNEPTPTAGQVKIRDNQIGISYEELFGAYFNNVKEVEIADPYIRYPYQVRNLMELMQIFIDKKEPGDPLEIHLRTFHSEGFKEKAIEYFEEVKQSLAEESIEFTYTFDEFLHDRYIQLDNGWKIVLGRGLDIFQKTNGMFDLAEYDQKKRKCRECEVTYVET